MKLPPCQDRFLNNHLANSRLMLLQDSGEGCEAVKVVRL